MSAVDTIREIADKIPGYRGYAEKEHRREADHALREATAAAFSSQVTRITRVQEQMMAAGDLDNIEKLDGAIDRLQHLADRIRTASYGYSGLFDRDRVDEMALDSLYAADLALANGVEQMGDLIAKLGLKEETPTKIVALRDHLDALHTAMDQRSQLLGQPAPEGEQPHPDSSTDSDDPLL